MQLTDLENKHTNTAVVFLIKESVRLPGITIKSGVHKVKRKIKSMKYKLNKLQKSNEVKSTKVLTY